MLDNIRFISDRQTLPTYFSVISIQLAYTNFLIFALLLTFP